MEYTKEMVSELKSRDTMTYAQAKAFADKFGLSLQSVIGKARALEVAYVRKDESKAKSTVTKADLVKAIEARAGVTFKRLDALLVEDLQLLSRLV